MATAYRTTSSRNVRRRWAGRLALGLFVLGAVLAAWFWQSLGVRARVDAAYGARVACSCHYVGKRDFAGCANEIAAETSFVFLSHDEEAKRVVASVPLLSSQAATYRAGAGCSLEKWED